MRVTFQALDKTTVGGETRSEENIVPVTIPFPTGTVSTRRVVISSGQTASHHVSMSDRVRRGNCISYGRYACRSGGAQWSIIVTNKITPYGLFTYIGTRGSSTSSLKYITWLLPFVVIVGNARVKIRQRDRRTNTNDMYV